MTTTFTIAYNADTLYAVIADGADMEAELRHVEQQTGIEIDHDALIIDTGLTGYASSSDAEDAGGDVIWNGRVHTDDGWFGCLARAQTSEDE